MKRIALLLLLAASPALAEVVASTPRGVIVAHSGSVELIEGGRTLWRTDSVATPSKIVTGSGRVAILDALHNRLRIVDLESGRGPSLDSAETPIDGTFLRGALFVIARDARLLERFDAKGRTAAIALDADPAYLCTHGNSLFVYSRGTGTIAEVETTGEPAIRRRLSMPPFASTMESDGETAYLVYPQTARVELVSLPQLSRSGGLTVGSVPVALARAGGGTALTARSLAVADPASRKVWLIEGRQSTAEAFARGFVRGLLGLGLFQGRTSQFPTGVDRVLVSGRNWIAYDSASRTLYRFSKSSSNVIATGIDPGEFAITPSGIAIWRDGKLVLR